MKYLAMLLLAAAPVAAKPPQAPRLARPAQAPTVLGLPCGKSSCDCGCEGGKTCRCASGGRAIPELQKSYAADWIAQGWTWSEEGGYWFKYPEAPAVTYAPAAPFYQPQFRPMTFGGFGGGGGGGC